MTRGSHDGSPQGLALFLLTKKAAERLSRVGKAEIAAAHGEHTGDNWEQPAEKYTKVSESDLPATWSFRIATGQSRSVSVISLLFRLIIGGCCVALTMDHAPAPLTTPAFIYMNSEITAHNSTGMPRTMAGPNNVGPAVTEPSLVGCGRIAKFSPLYCTIIGVAPFP
jgi:hypothetical protein